MGFTTLGQCWWVVDKFLVSRCFQVCTLFIQVSFRERCWQWPYSSRDKCCHSYVFCVVCKVWRFCHICCAVFLQLNQCRSLSGHIFSLERQLSFLLSFLSTALGLNWLNTIMIFLSKLCHLMVAFCPCAFVFVAFSALWTVASFTSTRLHTTWAFPLKCNLFLILLGLFVIVILLCDFFWVNNKKNPASLFLLWGHKHITETKSLPLKQYIIHMIWLFNCKMQWKEGCCWTYTS